MKRMLLPQSLVASLLSGATQVSMPVKPQLRPENEYPYYADDLLETCPFPVGTEVWVPETWNARDVVYDDYCGGFEAGYPLNPIPRVRPDFRYVVDYKATDGNEGPWRPAITMPSWAARLRYIIEEIEAGRMCDEKDQGRIPVGRLLGEGIIVSTEGRSMVDRYIARWNAAYPDYPWSGNPWRYTYTVRRL